MTQALAKIKREAHPDGYTFYLYDMSEPVGSQIVTSAQGKSPIAPQLLRNLQAKINSSRVLDDLGIF